MVLALIFVLAGQSDPLEKELADILRRFQSPEASLRDAASVDLEAFCRKAGTKAVDYLTPCLESPDAEVKARIRSQLSFLGRVQECRKFLAAFDLVGLPDCAGKKFVIYNPNLVGQSNDKFIFQYVLGWVLSETKDEVTLAEIRLTTVTHTRNRSLPKEWDRIKAHEPAGLPPPGEFRAIEPRHFFKEFKYPGGTTYMHHKDVDLCIDGLGLALCAYRALQAGEDRFALELLEVSRKGIVVMAWRDATRPYPDLLRKVLADHLRSQAITSANRGRSRRELIKNWKTVDELAPNLNGGEAREMVRLYEALLAEDATWNDPLPDELAKMPAGGQVGVWLHRLRDHDAYQCTIPGSCSVFGPWGRGKPVSPNPADELVKLGWDALPLLIDRLDDRHPTRCEVGDMGPGDLLRIGDCCQQILEAISGVPIWESHDRGATMMNQGKAAEAKTKAVKWWEEHRNDAPEKYYLKGLSNPKYVTFFARKLLGMDAKRHLPAVMEVLEKGDRRRRNSLLPLLRPHLTKAHQPLLEAVLKDEDLYVVTVAAQALWESCRVDAGAHEVLRRLANPREDEDGRFFGSFDFSTEERLSSVFRSIGSERLIDEIAALLKSPRSGVVSSALTFASGFPHHKMAEVLMGYLGDQRLTGWSSGYSVRYCDAAARSLINMLGLSEQFRMEGKVEDRDRTISELQAWWLKGRESIDWASLRKKAEDARWFKE